MHTRLTKSATLLFTIPGEEALYATFQSVLDAAANDPKLKQVLTQTALAAEKDLTGPLFEFHHNGRPIGNGWTSPPNGPCLHRNLPRRTDPRQRTTSPYTSAPTGLRKRSPAATGLRHS